MNKNDLIKLGKLLLWAIVITYIAVSIPRWERQHKIAQLSNSKAEIQVVTMGLSWEVEVLSNKFKACATNQPQWHKEADRLRERISELDRKIIEIDTEIAELVGIDYPPKSMDTEKLLWEWKLLWHKYIVIHHTATRTDATIQEIENNWKRKYGRPAAHIVIWTDWHRETVLDWDRNAGSTMNIWVNNYAIQIELIGNFNEAQPTLAQYKALKEVINKVEGKYWTMEIKWHKEVWKTACPWKFIDMEWIKNWLRDYDFSGIIEFNISRYYSPVEWQDMYFSAIEWFYSQEYIDSFAKYERWYEMDVCMNCGCDLDLGTPKKLYDCTVPADGRKLKADEAMKVVACPPEYKLWTKFNIEWLWIVTCRDRGWAIQNNRIDLWMWYWPNNREKAHWGIYFGKVIK